MPAHWMAGLFMAVACGLLAATRPLFHDEASTLFFCRDGLGHLLAMLQQDVHPPGYFLVAWGLVEAFGATPWPLRAFSCICMGLAVVVFLRGLQVWLGRRPGFAITLVTATSPFLAFSGYFARYYALVCLLWCALFLLLGKGQKQGSGRAYLGAGVLLAALYLTNYASALVAVAGCIPIGIMLLRQRGWRRLVYLCGPLCLAVALGFPLLQMQLSADLPNRVDGVPGLAHAVKSAGMLAWTLPLGDGVAPWSPEGPFLAAGLLLVGAVGAWLGLRRGPALPMCSALFMLGCGAAVGWLLLPGSGYAFLPPRVAACGFAWLLLVAAVLAQVKRPVALALVLAACNLWGLATMVVLQRTTNWAYTLPAHEIARAVESEFLLQPGPTAVYLPRKSFGNVYFYLEDSAAHQPLVALQPRMDEGLDKIESVIVVRQTRSPEWPPTQAVRGEDVGDPPGDWQRVSVQPFIQEDLSAGRIKRLLAGQEVYPDKIRVERWNRR